MQLRTVTGTGMDQIEKAQAFAALHIPGNPVILFNVWDAGSAKAVERAGAKAIATGSVSVAGALGFSDGENLPIDLAIANAERIVEAVKLPVTIDFEGGYAIEPDKVAVNVALVAASGAVGCNFEDQIVGSEEIYPIKEQSRRIRAIRSAVGAAFFINARTDLFLKAEQGAHDRALADQAVDRALAYADAGASGFFIPGLIDLKLVERIVKASPLPVNAMAWPGAPSRKQWADAGIARISHGPGPWRKAMAWLEEAAKAELG